MDFKWGKPTAPGRLPRGRARLSSNRRKFQTDSNTVPTTTTGTSLADEINRANQEAAAAAAAAATINPKTSQTNHVGLDSDLWRQFLPEREAALMAGLDRKQNTQTSQQEENPPSTQDHPPSTIPPQSSTLPKRLSASEREQEQSKAIERLQERLMDVRRQIRNTPKRNTNRSGIQHSTLFDRSIPTAQQQRALFAQGHPPPLEMVQPRDRPLTTAALERNGITQPETQQPTDDPAMNLRLSRNSLRIPPVNDTLLRTSKIGDADARREPLPPVSLAATEPVHTTQPHLRTQENATGKTLSPTTRPSTSSSSPSDGYIINAEGKPVRINLGRTRLRIREHSDGLVTIDIVQNGQFTNRHSFYVDDNGGLRRVSSDDPTGQRIHRNQIGVLLRHQKSPDADDTSGTTTYHSIPLTERGETTTHPEDPSQDEYVTALDMPSKLAGKRPAKDDSVHIVEPRIQPSSSSASTSSRPTLYPLTSTPIRPGYQLRVNKAGQFETLNNGLAIDRATWGNISSLGSETKREASPSTKKEEIVIADEPPTTSTTKRPEPTSSTRAPTLTTQEREASPGLDSRYFRDGTPESSGLASRYFAGPDLSTVQEEPTEDVYQRLNASVARAQQLDTVIREQQQRQTALEEQKRQVLDIVNRLLEKSPERQRIVASINNKAGATTTAPKDRIDPNASIEEIETALHKVGKHLIDPVLPLKERRLAQTSELAKSMLKEWEEQQQLWERIRKQQASVEQLTKALARIRLKHPTNTAPPPPNKPAEPAEPSKPAESTEPDETRDMLRGTRAQPNAPAGRISKRTTTATQRAASRLRDWQRRSATMTPSAAMAALREQAKPLPIPPPSAALRPKPTSTSKTDTTRPLTLADVRGSAAFAQYLDQRLNSTTPPNSPPPNLRPQTTTFQPLRSAMKGQRMRDSVNQEPPNLSVRWHNDVQVKFFTPTTPTDSY